MEIYYNSSTPPTAIVLKWNYKSGTKLYITCSNDYFTGCCSSYYTNGRSIWTAGTGSTYITLPDESSSTAKCDFSSPTENWWNSNYGDPANTVWNGYIIYGITWMWDTDSVRIYNYSTAYSSTKRIGAAIIYVNPHPDAFDGSYEDFGFSEVSVARQKALLAHELGHVMGLGHSDVGYYAVNDASLMKSSLDSISLSRTSYDLSELQAHIP